MKNIAEALVLNQAKAQGEKDNVARASQSYADQTRKYQKRGNESILEQLERMKSVDQVALFKNIQIEKRKIEKALSRNELSYIFGQSNMDQESLKRLRLLIEQHNRLKDFAKISTCYKKNDPR